MSEIPTEITAVWKGDLTFVGQNTSGGTVQMGPMDGRPGVGPMQLLLVGLAGCTGMDIIAILKKKRARVTDMQVRVKGERAADYPKIWNAIRIQYLLWGEELCTKDVEQAIRLSETKYCSVGAMLGRSAQLTSEYRILKPGETAESRSEQ